MKSFVFARALSVAKKEVRHILRDRLTLAMALGMPVGLVIFFGYVFDFDVRDIKLLVVNRDQTQVSRTLVDVFRASQYFDVEEKPSLTDPLQMIEAEKAKAIMIIEPGFSRDLTR